MDLKNIDNETLWKMFKNAEANYYREATKPCGNGNAFLSSPDAKKLEQLTKEYEIIGDELRNRLGVN